jgi:hypothetical protein
MATALISSFFVTLLWITMHLLLVHQKPCKRRLKAMTFAFLWSLPVLFLSLFFLQQETAIVLKLNGHENHSLAYGYAFLLHLLFFLFFVECFYHLERSVTLRILIEIDQTPTPTKIEEIEKNYSVDDMISRRLDDMLTHGWLYQKNDRWILSPKALFLAKAMRFSCWLFQSKPQDLRL